MTTASAWWFNPHRNECFLVIGTHDDWLKCKPNAEMLGVSPRMQEFIASTNDIDEIRLAALMEGMVRIRDYHHRVSVQFMAEQGTRELLSKLYRCLNDKLRKTSWMVLQNVLNQETHEISLSELGSRLEGPSFQLFQDIAGNNQVYSSAGPKIAKLVDWIKDHPSSSR